MFGDLEALPPKRWQLCFFALMCVCIYVFIGGYYHGKLIFPREFPFKPPSIYMLTPSGRFNVNTRFHFLFVFTFCIVSLFANSSTCSLPDMAC